MLDATPVARAPFGWTARAPAEVPVAEGSVVVTATPGHPEFMGAIAEDNMAGECSGPLDRM